MKIIEAQSATLTNYEVYIHLSELKKKYEQTPKLSKKFGDPPTGTYKRRGPGNYETVTKEVMDYLTTKPSPLHMLTYDSTSFKTLLERLRPYELTKAEILMILNLKPSDECTLNMVVEEMYTRHSPEQHEEMIRIIAEVLGTPEPKVDDDAMEM